MRIVVGIPTVGRPELAARTVARLRDQSRPPDAIIVVGGSEADVAGIATPADTIVAVAAPRGLCRQRNRILELAGPDAELIVFLDDDFVPAPHYLARAERLFATQPDVVGATGRIIADGIKTSGYGFDEAVRLADNDPGEGDTREFPAEALYGCNMVLRRAALEGLRFDEALPLYGWLEDIDLTYRLARRGRLIRSHYFAGVHMGAKAGRTSGFRLGYSQIANPIYLLGKRSAPRHLAMRMMGRNLAANLAGSFWPEPHIDRRGRLRGNGLALLHLMTRRLDPGHILNLR